MVNYSKITLEDYDDLIVDNETGIVILASKKNSYENWIKNHHRVKIDIRELGQALGQEYGHY